MIFDIIRQARFSLYPESGFPEELKTLCPDAEFTLAGLFYSENRRKMFGNEYRTT